jgi:hypothetical protein
MHDFEHFSVWVDELIRRGEGLQRDPKFPQWVESSQFDGWTAAVDHFLIELLGPESVYYLEFHRVSVRTGVVTLDQRASCMQVLLSLRDDLTKGRLVSFRALVTAEVFGDFLDMAQHLLDHAYKDPSASLIGAVLEVGMREFAVANGLKIRAREDLTGLNNRLAEKGIYTHLVQKSIAVWIDVRNHADHGQFGEYTIENVRSMHSGVREFLARYE